VNTRACFRILAVCDLKPLRAAEDELERAELEKCEMVPDTARNCLLFGQEWTFADVRVHVRFAPEKGTFLNAVLMSALCQKRTLPGDTRMLVNARLLAGEFQQNKRSYPFYAADGGANLR
jgi:hypothetical protein